MTSLCQSPRSRHHGQREGGGPLLPVHRQERKKSKKDNTVKSPLTEPSKKPAASGKGDQVIIAIVAKEDMPRLEEDADSDGTFEAEEEEEETEDALIVSGRPDEDQYEAAVEDPNRRQARGHAAHDQRWEP